MKLVGILLIVVPAWVLLRWARTSSSLGAEFVRMYLMAFAVVGGVFLWVVLILWLLTA